MDPGGKERILVSPSGLSVKRDLFGMGRIREYDKQHISDLRVSPRYFWHTNPMIGQLS